MTFCKCCGALIDATNATLKEVEARYTKFVMSGDSAKAVAWCPICSSNPANLATCAQMCVDKDGKKISMFDSVDGIHASKSIVYQR